MRPGDVVANRFELLAIAGTGGMGTVYRARDVIAGDDVALKTLSLVGEHEAARFAREAALLADLAHPGIVRYVAHGLSAGHVPFIAMEWLDGETLQHRLQRGRLSLADAVGVTCAIAEALALAHRRGVVHRDIKPGNVMLVGGDARRVKVLDFGIARTQAQAGVLTNTGAVLGTPGYMAPEQVRGDIAMIDARTDVFALGCVLYRCLTGVPAFGGGESLAVLAKILVDDVLAPSAIHPDIPPSLDAVVLAMLAKDPAARPADGGQVAQLLAGVADATALGVPVLAELDPAIARTIAADLPATEVTSTTPKITATEQRLVSIVLAGAGDTGQLGAIATTFGGRVERIADGAHIVMFGDGGAATDHAVRAARCALALRDVAPIGFVVASGRAALSNLPVGDVIDRAVPLLAGLTASQIAIDEPTRALLDESFVLDARADKVLLRGIRDGAPPARTLLGRATPMVGRDREIANLEGLWADCTDEPRARAVVVTAPAGGGKSRLRHELVRRILQRDENAEILAGRGDPVGAGSPFAMIAEAIRRAAGVRSGDPLDAQRAALHARVSRSVRELDAARVTHLLGELAGVAFPSDASPVLRAARADPLSKNDAMRAAWVDWLAAECAAHPVLLVLEDLHWGDRATVDYVDAALRALAHAPLMVVALARPAVHDQFPRLWHERDVQEIRLPALTRKAGERLARDLLGGSAAEETIVRIVERANGNAFFLEELIRAVAEGRDDLPDSVLAMLQQRLDALPVDTRRALRAASVFGEVFWRGGVHALTGTDPRAHLATLVERELVSDGPHTTIPGEHEYAFRHDLVREAAYATMGDADRALGHRLAAEWLVAHGFTDALALAGHFWLGGQPLRAAEHFANAASHANEGGDSASALAHVERGLACNPSGELLGRLLLARAEAHNWRAAYAECEIAATAAADALPHASGAWFHAQDERFYAAGRQGDSGKAMRVLHAMTTAPPAPGAELEQLRSVARAAIIMLRFGPPGVGAALVTRVEELASHMTLDLGVDQRLHTMRAFAARMRGDALASIDGQEKALEACVLGHNLREMAFTYLSYGGLFDELGAPDRAIPLLTKGIEIAERVGADSVGGLLYMSRGLTHLHLREHDRVRADAERAIASGDPAAAAIARFLLALSMLECGGDPDEALQLANAAVDGSSGFGEFHAIATAARAQIHLARNDVEAARRDASEARRTMRPHDGFQFGESLIRLAEVQALEAANDPRAPAVRAEAIARLHARAANIVEPWRTSFLARPENALTLAGA